MNSVDLHSPLEPPQVNQSTAYQKWSGFYGSAAALSIAQTAQSYDGLIVLITKSNRDSDRLSEAIRFYLSGSTEIPVYIFPGWECLPYDEFSPHQDILSERINLLSKLPYIGKGILVVAVETLMQRLAPVDYINQNSFSFATGEQLIADAFQRKIDAASYRRVPQVELPGEYVIRGGVIDVFPMGSVHPIRIELFGDIIETLRFFDAETQLTINKIDMFRALPGSEVPMDEVSIRNFRQGFREHIDADPQENTVYRDISSKSIPSGSEFYLPLFFNQTSSLLDYIGESAVYFLFESYFSSVETFWVNVEERYRIASKHENRLPVKPEILYYSPSQFEELLNSVKRVIIAQDVQLNSVQFESVPPAELQQHKVRRELSDLLKESLHPSVGKTLICVDGFGQKSTLETALKSIGISFEEVDSWGTFLTSSTSVAICLSNLPEGLALPKSGLGVRSSEELFGVRVKPVRKSRTTRSLEGVISSLEELEIGDIVVHEQYGIGRYQGLVSMDATGMLAEFMTIEYSGDDTLYVPIYGLEKVTRYIGGKSDEVELHSLGSKQWSKYRRKARQQAFDVAAELLEIQSLRESRAGNRMPLPSKSSYEQFTSRFSYRETTDQQKAIDEVLRDLESSRPMDRLVCGDVGFGKTEVALRAAFVAVENGYQVAVVVPTTLLAQQHYEVFQNRFAEFGAEIALLSRIETTSMLRKQVEKIAAGQIEIAIGTHRLLQSDVVFKNLGLLIIDEEHRFGVRHKEHLKKKRTDVDILTLTATPIPRTLSMVLNQVRDMSIIATPPDNRLSVRTSVNDWNPEIIREACMRELGRGGQIFYVHNEVRTIEQAAKELKLIVPEADIRFAHGQMPKVQLEQTMKDFYLQKFNTLVCSTIIESGIDIPAANTIVINNAAKFGLAQLHQLRGRVGRSHHQAYAYLLVPSKSYLKGKALLRLESIESFDQLGIGYVIATHDMEIRGAGTILGETQSGAINDIGYTMYADYLKKAVVSLKKASSDSSGPDNFAFEQKTSVEINLQSSALIPEDWISNVNLRLTLYRRIASAPDSASLEQLELEMSDRFGKLPIQTEMLFHINHLKLKCQNIGIQKFNMYSTTGQLVFESDPNFSIEGLRSLMSEYPGRVSLSKDQSAVNFVHSLNDAGDRLSTAYKIIQQLSPHVPNTVATASDAVA